MTEYFRIRLGKKNVHAQECFDGNFIGADCGIRQDLSARVPDEWRTFNREFIPIYLQSNPGKTKVAAGLACGMLHTICKGIKKGDILPCPDAENRYHVGQVTGDYTYQPEGILPHRRAVQWRDRVIAPDEMSDTLRDSIGSGDAVCMITRYAEEILRLIAGGPPTGPERPEEVEDASAFAMEQHLEDFLIKNWAHTELGKDYTIYAEEGEYVGQQYPTDTGPLDILAISKDKKTLLIIELKKGRASDVVVGQILRYMGYVQEELAEEGQNVRGIIIALEDDQRIRRALKMVPHVEFYRYQISFKLAKA